MRSARERDLSELLLSKLLGPAQIALTCTRDHLLAVTRTNRMLNAFLDLVTASTVACLPHRLHRHEEGIPLRLSLAADEVADKLAEAA